MDRPETIQNLQKSLAMELTAAHQYQLHAAVLSDWGLDKLGAKMLEEMREELGHSDAFIQRLMFLKAAPNLVLDKVPEIATCLKELFASDLADEQDAIVFYTSAARQAGDAGDVGSRLLFEKILVDEEGHMAWLELQLDLIERMGEPNFIAKHMTAP